MTDAIHRDGHLQEGQTAGCSTEAWLVTWIPESCRATSVLRTLALCHKALADLPCLLFTVQNSYVTGRNIPPACLVLRAVGVRVTGGDKGLRQSCPSLGNVGRWESSSGGDGAKEGPGLVGAVRSAAVVDPEALGDLLAAQWAGAQWLAALLAAADMATGEEDHLGLTFQAHNTL